MIFNKGINMEQKPFAIGVRVEHPQEKDKQKSVWL